MQDMLKGLWLPGSNPENAERLLQAFESQQWKQENTRSADR